MIWKLYGPLKYSLSFQLIVWWQYEKALGDEGANLGLVSSIEKNANHYIEILSRAVDNVMPEPQQDLSFKDDVLDVLMSMRSRRNEQIQKAEEANIQTGASIFPPELTRRYTLNLKPVTPSGSSSERSTKALAVR